MNLSWRLGVGTAVAAATFGVAYALGRPRAVRLEQSLPPVPAPLEPWEEEAEFGGDVDPGVHDDIVEPYPQGTIIGEGSPDELCTTAENPLPEEACVLDPLKDERFAPRKGRAPLGARGTTAAIWPVATRHRRRLATSYWTKEGLRGAWGRQFGSLRQTSEGQMRRHSGVDLFAREDDVVVAPEAGRVVAILPFHHGTWAVYLRIPGGRVINLGEIQKYSWRRFGIRPGVQVVKGQALARVGKMSGGAHMLHVQLYDAADALDEDLVEEIRRGEMRWLEDSPPVRVLDPSAYLVDAAARTHRAEAARA